MVVDNVHISYTTTDVSPIIVLRHGFAKMLQTGAIISRMNNRLAYKIVKRHYLDEDPTIKHDENCSDIVYMIDTGYGKIPKAFATREEAGTKLEELNNNRN